MFAGVEFICVIVNIYTSHYISDQSNIEGLKGLSVAQLLCLTLRLKPRILRPFLSPSFAAG